MRITAEDASFEAVIILLNDMLVKTAVAADDEEGWVDIIDIASMAPIENTSTKLEEPEEVEELPLKRLHGNVRIIVNTQNTVKGGVRF